MCGFTAVKSPNFFTRSCTMMLTGFCSGSFGAFVKGARGSCFSLGVRRLVQQNHEPVFHPGRYRFGLQVPALQGRSSGCPGWLAMNRTVPLWGTASMISSLSSSSAPWSTR